MTWPSHMTQPSVTLSHTGTGLRICFNYGTRHEQWYCCCYSHGG